MCPDFRTNTGVFEAENQSAAISACQRRWEWRCVVLNASGDQGKARKLEHREMHGIPSVSVSKKQGNLFSGGKERTQTRV